MIDSIKSCLNIIYVCVIYTTYKKIISVVSSKHDLNWQQCLITVVDLYYSNQIKSIS